MISNKKQTTPQLLTDFVVKGMQEKKAIDIKVLDLRRIKNSIADYFIIASGNSDTQVEAIMQSIEEQVYKNLGQRVWKKEGWETMEWVILDFVDVIVHVFQKEKRVRYGLEDLWGDAEITSYENVG